MKHFRQIFTLILLSSCMAYTSHTSSDDESHTSVPRSQGSSLSNPDNREETPIPDFASLLPEGSPYRGSISGINQAAENGVYHIQGTNEYALRVGVDVDAFTREAILYSITECNSR